MATAVAHISREMLRQKLENGDDFVLLDALSPTSYAGSHLPGAINMPPEWVDERAALRIPGHDTEVVVYCASSVCDSSMDVANRLIDLGYRNVRHYAEGKRDWVEAGLPLEGSRVKPPRIATMPGYTIKNLKEVEDAALKFGLSPELEARFARELELENSAVSYQRLAPNFRVPFGHTHKQQEELYLIVGGSGRIKLDDDVVELRQWDAVRISKETGRSVEAGPEGLEFIAFGAPNTGPGDAEVTQGWWAD